MEQTMEIARLWYIGGMKDIRIKFTELALVLRLL
jgi:hypothetical protein